MDHYHTPNIESGLYMVKQDNEPVDHLTNAKIMMNRKNRDFLCGQHHRTDVSPPSLDDETPIHKETAVSIREHNHSLSRDEQGTNTQLVEAFTHDDILVSTEVLEHQ